jgi:hypothetical protein
VSKSDYIRFGDTMLELYIDSVPLRVFYLCKGYLVIDLTGVLFSFSIPNIVLYLLNNL